MPTPPLPSDLLADPLHDAFPPHTQITTTDALKRES